MEDSARLAMPFMQQGQAQKHVTHNEALEVLDILVQMTVEAFGTDQPPAAPEEGQVWALGPTPGGGWVGQEFGTLAAWSHGGWYFIKPRTGWRAAHGDDLRVWTGTAWAAPRLPELNHLPGLGVNAQPDGNNRLAVASQAVLFTHEGTDHRLKVNKATAGDTASLLIQTGFPVAPRWVRPDRIISPSRSVPTAPLGKPRWQSTHRRACRR
jgi:hypothetical protein